MLPTPHKVVTCVRLGLWFTLCLCFLSCDEATSPEFYTPLVIRGVIDADRGSTSSRPFGFVDVEGRSGTPTEDFSASFELVDDGAFAIAVPEGEFSVSVHLEGSRSFYVDQEGVVSGRRTSWISTTQESPLPDLYIPLGSLSLTIEEDRGAPWRVYLDSRQAEFFDTYRGLTSDEPLVVRYLPLSSFIVFVESAYGEMVALQAFDGDEPTDSLHVRDASLKSYRLSVPEPAVVRYRVEGPSLDWNVRELELVLDDPYLRSYYEGPVYDGLEIPLYVFTPEPSSARINLGAGRHRLPFGAPRFDYYLPTPEKELVITAEFAALEFVVAGSVIDLDEFRMELYAANYPGLWESVYMDAFATEGASSGLVPIPAGRWRIKIAPDFDTQLPDQWVDAAATRSTSRVFDFVAGETSRIEWTPWPGGRLRGKVSRVPGEVEALLLVKGDEESSFGTVSVPVAKDGSFDIDGLEHGTYRLAFVSAAADPHFQYFPGGVGFEEAQIFGFEDILMFDDLYFEVREGAPLWSGGPISWVQ